MMSTDSGGQSSGASFADFASNSRDWLGRQQTGHHLLRSDAGGDPAVARGEEQARTGRLREKGLEVAGIPDVVHHDQRGLSAKDIAVGVDTASWVS